MGTDCENCSFLNVYDCVTIAGVTFACVTIVGGKNTGVTLAGPTLASVKYLV